MKLKNLLIATLSISLFVVSCTKEDITVTKSESVLTNDVKTMSINSTNSEITNNKAYIFIEPKSKYPMVATYLNSTNTNNTPRVKFAGFEDEEDAEEYAQFLAETLPLLLFETTRLN